MSCPLLFVSQSMEPHHAMHRSHLISTIPPMAPLRGLLKHISLGRGL